MAEEKIIDEGPNDEAEEVDLGELVSKAVEEKLTALGIDPKASGGVASSEASSASAQPASSSGPASASGDGKTDDLASRVEAAVTKALGERDHAADHDKLREGSGSPVTPPAPSSDSPVRKPRGQVASFLFGKRA